MPAHLGTTRRHLGRAAAVLAAAAVVLVAALATATTALAAPETSTLRANEQLGPGQRLVTTTGVTLTMGTNGNLVENAPGNRVVWSLSTNRPGTLLRMQADGNVVLVIPGNYTIWSTGTAGNPGATLELQPDGNATVLTAARVAKWNNGVHLAITPTTTPAPPTSTPGSPTADVATLTNTERAKAGCAALRADARLATSAQGHAADMATNKYFSHVSLDGRTFDQRIRAAGYPSPGGENIAVGYPTAAAVMTGWMNSAGHRANILNCAFTAIGVGYDARGNYWVQNFGY